MSGGDEGKLGQKEGGRRITALCMLLVARLDRLTAAFMLSASRGARVRSRVLSHKVWQLPIKRQTLNVITN